MRLEEKCRCGGEITIVYETGRRSQYSSSEMDAYDAHKQIDNWRRRHKDCLTTTGPTHETPKKPA